MQGLSFVLKLLNDTHQTDTDALVPIKVDHVLKVSIVSATNCKTDIGETNGTNDPDKTNSKIVS